VQRRIFLATALVVVVTLMVGIGAAFVIRNRVASSAADELARQARATAEVIEERLTDVQFRPGDNPGAELNRYRSVLQRSLLRAEKLGGHDIVEAALTVRDRQIPINEPLVLLPLVPDDVAEGEVVTVDVGGEPMLVVVEKLEGRVGTLTVAIGRSQPILQTGLITVPLVVALAVAAVLTIALGVWFGRSLSRRLRNLETAALAVGEGQLDTRSPVEGSDEIAAVAVAFNTMTEQLQDVRTREREFLMSVSHDLRTPLTTIRGYAEALDGGDIPESDLPRVAGILNAQTDQLSRLVEDVMLLARIEAHEYTIRPEPVDVAALVGGVSGTFVARAEGSSIAFEIMCDDSGDRLVDPDRLSQVLSNLIENALRYTPDGGEIGIGTASAPGAVEIFVRNSGPGIAPSDVSRVFDRLYVAERYRAIRPAGSGLGLAIVSEVVEAMGGTVRCSSDPMAGTEFRMTFPTQRL
jgi:two-component system sensor histidine kinase BaeS